MKRSSSNTMRVSHLTLEVNHEETGLQKKTGHVRISLLTVRGKLWQNKHNAMLWSKNVDVVSIDNVSQEDDALLGSKRGFIIIKRNKGIVHIMSLI